LRGVGVAKLGVVRLGVARLALLAGSLAVCPAPGALRIQLIEGRPIVDGVRLNGHGPYRFLIDTGTTLNHFDARLAKSAGLEPSFRSELITFTGVTQAQGASGIEVKLDSLVVADQTFLFAGIDALQQEYPDVVGVLGEEFLSRFDYLLDLRGRRIEFGSREPDASKVRAPMRTVAGRPVVPTNLGDLVLDSGVNQLTLYYARAAQLTHRMITMTGSITVGMVPSHLVIGGRTFWRGDAVAISHPAESETTGLLPASMFRTVYVSNSNGYVVFE
jgi:hypothetical protein